MESLGCALQRGEGGRGREGRGKKGMGSVIISPLATHLPDVLLQQCMDDDPHHTVEHRIEPIQRPVPIVGLWERPVVNTSGLRVCTREETVHDEE